MRYHVEKERKCNTNKEAVLRVSIKGLVLLSCKIKDKNTFVKNATTLLLGMGLFATGMGLAHRDQVAAANDLLQTMGQDVRLEQVVTSASSLKKDMIHLATPVSFVNDEAILMEDNTEPVAYAYYRPVKQMPIKFGHPDEIEQEEEIEELDRELTREEKLALVMEYHGIASEFQYYQIVSVLANEGGPENYNECYDVLCAAYNRTLSKAWCHDCRVYNKNADGTEKDPTLITSQLLWRSQFSGYLPSKAGYDREEYEGTKADEAALDFLYQAMLDGNAVRSHDYTSFNAPWYEGCPASAVQLNPKCKGNCYFYKLKQDDLNDKALELGIELGISR